MARGGRAGRARRRRRRRPRGVARRARVRRRRRGRRRRDAAAGGGGGGGGGATAAAAANATLRLSCSNDYERTLGIPIGDGLYEQYGGLLAEMHQVTRLEASVARGDGADDDGDDGGGSASYDWDVDGDAVSRGGGRAVNVTFSALGAHAVRVSRSLAGSVLGMGGAVTGEFTVYAKCVRAARPTPALLLLLPLLLILLILLLPLSY